MKKAFLFLAESALCASLFLLALAFLPLFSIQGGNEQEIAACADAAGVLIKLSAFDGQEKLESVVSALNSLSQTHARSPRLQPWVKAAYLLHNISSNPKEAHAFRRGFVSPMCISAKAGGLMAGDCPQGGNEKIAFSFPANVEGSILPAEVSCTLP